MIMLLKTVVTFCSLVLFTIQSHANTPAPEDFAYGMTVKTEGQASIWKLGLPEEVYRKVTRPDLGDIRVFDASGQIVPHVLRRPEAEMKEPPQPVSLPFYPLYESDNIGGESHSIRYITDDKGSVVRIIREKLPAETDEVISAYLIDASELENRPDKLILEWDSGQEMNFSENINLQVSDNLRDWSRLIRQATIANLQFSGHKLTRQEIDLPARQYKYLRIDWPESLRDLGITAFTASFPSSAQPLERYWLKVDGTRNEQQAPGYNFDTRGNWPIDQARISFAGQNILVNLELSSRQNDSQAWQRRYAGQIYRLLREDGTRLDSPPVNFNLTSDRFWQIEEVGDANVLANNVPGLELGWVPHVLNFIGQGTAPYVIAFGSSITEPLVLPDSQLMISDEDSRHKLLVKTAAIESSYLLGGETKLLPPPEPFPWKTLILWVILVAGTVLLALMVWRLYKGLNRSAES